MADLLQFIVQVCDALTELTQNSRFRWELSQFYAQTRALLHKNLICLDNLYLSLFL